MSRVATALIQVTIEYEVDETFDDDVSINDMRDHWTKFIELEDNGKPDEWEYIETEISRITCEGEEWERW